MIDFLWYTNKLFINIMFNKNSYINKFELFDDSELGNFLMYLFCILDEYYIYYLESKEV